VPPDKSDRNIYFQDYLNPGPWVDNGTWESHYQWQLAQAQWVSDSTNFMNGDPLVEPDTNDGTKYHTHLERLEVQLLWEQDQGFVDKYNADYGLYLSEVQAHTDGTDVDYKQVWNSDVANTDGLLDLNAWLGICGMKGDAACPCILVKPNSNIADWQGNYTPEDTGSYPLARTHGLDAYCSNGPCPDIATQYIEYNISNSYLYKNNEDKVIINNDYILHPSAPLESWYTGPAVPGVYFGYSDHSFRDLIEHEIGHFLSMQHADRVTDDSVQCPNNYTQCRKKIPNYWMMMSTAGFRAGEAPKGLGPDDICMFKKMYCPDQLGVAPAQNEEPEPPSPEVYPNPSNGGMTLSYTVSKYSFVQVMIYDALGNVVHESYSAYEAAGSRSISLGSELLPSGHYACRVRVGERVSYINLVISK
jgi:hypothetical protein